LNVLALEPYYGGSHRAFLEGWRVRSRHRFTVLTLPAHKWKWRMRHAAVTFADEVAARVARGEQWDVVFCSDMLNLAEFRGLAPAAGGGLPTAVYFHENQLTYPVRHESQRDYQFAMTNLTTALSAEAVWFNSDYHRSSFLSAAGAFLKRMPDHQDTGMVERIAAKTSVQHPAVEDFPPRRRPAPGPLRICWAARWEHDKNPEAFFEALKRLKERGVPFRLNVLGEQFRDIPPVFEWARGFFSDRIDRWGYQPTREAYRAALLESHVIVSTANHEFFGLSIVEAVAAGAYPLLPQRLSYPEILALNQNPEAQRFFYDGSVEQLAAKLNDLAERLDRGDLRQDDADWARSIVKRFCWRQRAPALDNALEKLAGSSQR